MVKSTLGCVLLFTGISLLMTEVSAGTVSSLDPCEENKQCSEMEYCAPDRTCRPLFVSLGGVLNLDSIDSEEFLTDSVAIVTSTQYLLCLTILPPTCAKLLY